MISESVSGLPGGQQAALLAALPALENLAEDLRDTVRRGRGRLGTRRGQTDQGSQFIGPNGALLGASW